MSFAWPSNRAKKRPSRGMSRAMKFIVVVIPSFERECTLPHGLSGGSMSRVLVLGAALIVGTGAYAQEVALSFTAAQAQQGRAVYDSTCVTCHGANLDDGPRG